MPTALGNKMSGMKSAYNAGDQQSMGLGKELNERMKMNALGSRDRGAVALSGSDKPKAKKPAKAKGPKRMSIEKLDDNSFSVTHHNDGKEPMQPDQKFSARNAKHLVRHVRQTFGGAAEPEMPEAPESGQPV